MSQNIDTELKRGPGRPKAEGAPEVRRESLNDFLNNIAHAQLNKDKWVETTKDIMLQYNRKGMGGKEYFIFQGIHVCEHGNAERLEKDIQANKSVDQYGAGYGKIESLGGQ